MPRKNHSNERKKRELHRHQKRESRSRSACTSHSQATEAASDVTTRIPQATEAASDVTAQIPVATEAASDVTAQIPLDPVGATKATVQGSLGTDTASNCPVQGLVANLMARYEMDQREKQEAHEQRKKQNKVYMKTRRSCSSVRSKENRTALEKRTVKRRDPKTKMKEVDRETKGRKRKRDCSEIRLKEAETDKIARRRRRADSEVRSREKARATPLRRQRRADSEVRSREKAIETPLRRKRRADSEVRSREKARETPLRRKRRADSEVRSREKAIETPLRRKRRADSEVRSREKARETPLRRKRRADSEARSREKARETPLRRQRRADSEVRSREKAIETPLRRKRRADSEVRSREKARETPLRRKRRADSEVRSREKARETPLRRKRRADSEVRSREKAIETPLRRKRRADSEVRSREKARETPLRRQRRADSEVRSREKAIETPLRRKRRADSEVRSREKARETPLRRKRRADSEVRSREKAIETPLRRKRRADSEVRSREKARETPLRRQRRADSEARSREKARATPLRRQRRADSEVRSREKARATPLRRQRRADSEVRSREKARATPLRRQRRADSEVRSREKARETPLRRKRRADSEVRSREKARETPLRRKRRADSEVRSREKARETPLRRKRRADSEVRSREKAIETPLRRKGRADSEVRSREKARETPLRRKRRADSEVRSREKARETPLRRKRRADSEARSREKARETPLRRQRRADSEVRSREKAIETPLRRKRRADSEVRSREKARATPLRRKRRADSEVRSREKAIETPLRRKRRADSEVRSREKAIETPLRRKRRADSEVRSREKARETPLRRKRRADSEVRSREKAIETPLRRKRRADSEVRSREKARETPLRRKRRADSEVRSREKARETPLRRKRRADSEVRSREKARATPLRRKRRADSEVRSREKAIETPLRRKRRADSEVRSREKARETPLRRKRRADSEVRSREKAIETPLRRKRRADSEVRSREKARETPLRRKRRADSEVRSREKARETPLRRKRRADSEVRSREKARETPLRRKRRADSEARSREKAIETPLRRKRRADSEVRSREKARETPLRRQRRALPDDEKTAIDNFKREIQNGPTYICTCCSRLLYRNSVVEFIETDFERCSADLISTCRQQIGKPKEFICVTCKTSLRKNMVPILSPANNMDLDELPQSLQVLNNLEVTLISRRIPFMKILALPRGKQKCIHGTVVNVPIEPEESVSVLPRVPSPESMVLVQVKRKLQYRGYSYKQNVHPNRIKDALHVLKNSLKNPLYSDVVVDNQWERNSASSNEELWNALTSSFTGEDNDSGKEKSDTEEGQDSDEEENERTKLSGVQFDTCLQPKDITTDTNLILNLAPGEGKKPKSFTEDKNSEELSFPQHFPTGKFGFSMARTQKLTLKKYFQARVLNHDGRFSRDPQYLFYAQYRCEAKDVQDCLSVALRKGKDNSVTVKDIKERVADIIHSDLGIHFLQKVRGSPAYFNKMLYDLLGMIRQLGPCTWFITLSAADLKWYDTIRIIAEQQGKILSDDDISNLSYEQRADYLRSNPVTAARHFNNRVQLFLKHILLNNELKPLGEITDYKYRIEFQQRGSPHVHMLAWIKDSPTFESNSEDEIQQFLDNHITCELPNEDKELRDTLLLVQKHTHSVACRKHGKACRFKFPRWPVPKTLALKPMQEAPTKVSQECFGQTLEAVNKQLLDIDPTNQMTFEELMRKAAVSVEIYLKALHWVKTKNRQPAILLKRSPNEVNINNYNNTLMKCWEANLDVQFVTNTFACVMYVASYVSKPEKTLGDVLKAVNKSSVSLGPKTCMKTVAKKFLSHREISAQEATFRLLSLPLVQGSRQIVYIPTGLPQQRTRLMKPLKLLERLDDDDTDVYMTSLLERYAARPKALETMFLADFAAKYRYCGGKKTSGNSSDEDSCKNAVTLQNQMGCMALRRTPAIIRSHQWSLKKQPEQYYHSQLLLYLPWRNETEDLCKESFQNSYMENLEVIEENKSVYHLHADEVSMAVENLEQTGDPEEAWNVLDPQTQQDRTDVQEEGPQAIDSVMNAFDPENRRTVSADIGFPQFEVEFSVENMTTSEYYSLLHSLNKLQSELHQFVVEWCSKMLLSHRIPAPEPFHIFLTGGAGVGKSHVVRAIVQTVSRLLMRSGQEDESHVLVCAPTGAAAYNVSGYTLHSAFHLPLHSRSTDDYIPLSGEKLATLKEAIGNIKLLIIDEVSMVGGDMLLTVHRRLCDVMGNEEPFGGISVLAVGDLMQLPPVAQKAVFSCPSDELAAIYGSLWQNHFKIAELTEIQRQKDDVAFADLLNRVRTGSQTDSDLLMLEARQIQKDSTNYPTDVTHIFAYNKNVNEHNSDMLKTLSTTIHTFRAQDSKRDEQTGCIDATSFKDMSGGLFSALSLAIGARVMVVKNLDVADGLVNSAVGTVTGFIPSPLETEIECFKPKYILVKFDDERVGKRSRLKARGLLPDSDDAATPIPAVESQIRLGKYSKVTAKRLQFPLTLAWGLTIHKEQGKTESRLVVSCEGSFHPGQFYTAVSRTKDISGLFFLGKVTANKIKVNIPALQEIERMKKSARFTPLLPDSLNSSMDMFFNIMCFNVNSLKPHWESLCKSNYLQSAQISCLSETWVKSSEPSPTIPGHSTLVTNKKLGRGGGLAMFIHNDLHVLKQFSVPDIRTEHQLVIVSPKLLTTLRICVLSLYHNPQTLGRDFLPELEALIAAVPQGLIAFVVGDFNVDTLTKSKTASDLDKLMRYHGYRQYVEAPTHRRGGSLDHLYCNRLLEGICVDTIPTYFSDHFLISAAVPWLSLVQ